MAGRALGTLITCLVLGGAACAEPVLELRRVVHVQDGELTPAQRELLGCDPCVRLEVDPAFGPLVLYGGARPDLLLARSDLARAELRRQPAPLGFDGAVDDLLLVTRPAARARLEALRAGGAVRQVAVSLDGRVIALTSPATWPERVFLARYRDAAAVPDLVRRFRLPLDRVTPAGSGR